MQTSLFIKRYWLECAFSFICVSSPPLSYQQNNIQKNRPRLYNETDLVRVVIQNFSKTIVVQFVFKVIG